MEPFRAHVDSTALGGGIAWRVTKGPQEDNGLFGPNKVDTEYTHESDSPPFSGSLLVISLRQAGGFSSAELRALAQEFLHAAARDNMTLDVAKSADGERVLRNGLATQWFVNQGTWTHPDPNGLFDQDDTVGMIVEVGYDGLSSTAVAAIGTATLASHLQCPILGPCSPQSDLRTWNKMVGDPSGSIGQARDASGLLYNLVTHG